MPSFRNQRRVPDERVGDKPAISRTLARKMGVDRKGVFTKLYSQTVDKKLDEEAHGRVGELTLNRDEPEEDAVCSVKVREALHEERPIKTRKVSQAEDGRNDDALGGRKESHDKAVEDHGVVEVVQGADVGEDDALLSAIGEDVRHEQEADHVHDHEDGEGQERADHTRPDLVEAEVNADQDYAADDDNDAEDGERGQEESGQEVRRLVASELGEAVDTRDVLTTGLTEVRRADHWMSALEDLLHVPLVRDQHACGVPDAGEEGGHAADDDCRPAQVDQLPDDLVRRAEQLEQVHPQEEARGERDADEDESGQRHHRRDEDAGRVRKWVVSVVNVFPQLLETAEGRWLNFQRLRLRFFLISYTGFKLLLAFEEVLDVDTLPTFSLQRLAFPFVKLDVDQNSPVELLAS